MRGGLQDFCLHAREDHAGAERRHAHQRGEPAASGLLSELEVDKLIGVLGLAKRSSTTEIPTLTTATVLSGTLITDWNGLQVSPRF